MPRQAGARPAEGGPSRYCWGAVPAPATARQGPTGRRGGRLGFSRGRQPTGNADGGRHGGRAEVCPHGARAHSLNVPEPPQRRRNRQRGRGPVRRANPRRPAGRLPEELPVYRPGRDSRVPAHHQTSVLPPPPERQFRSPPKGASVAHPVIRSRFSSHGFQRRPKSSAYRSARYSTIACCISSGVIHSGQSGNSVP